MANILSTGFSVSARDLEDSLCPHVEAGVPAYAVFKEDDSFGPVGRYAVCKDCYTAEEASQEEEVVGCDDCHGRFPRREVRSWRWYDFYAPQGDEAYQICGACWDEPKHAARRAEDAEDRAAEFGDAEFGD